MDIAHIFNIATLCTQSTENLTPKVQYCIEVDLDCYNGQCSISLFVCPVDGYRPYIRYCHLISWLCTQSGTDVLSNSVFAVSMAVAHIFNAAIQSNGYIHNQRKSD